MKSEIKLPKFITKPFRLLVRYASYDYRIYKFFPSGKVLVIEFESLDVEEKEGLVLHKLPASKIMKIKRRFVRSDYLSSRSYIESKEKLCSRINIIQSNFKKSYKNFPRSLKKDLESIGPKILKLTR